MDGEKQTELMRFYVRLQEATYAPHAQAIQVYEVARELEDLTKDTTISYASLRVRVFGGG
jgi:hypothetical protein